MLIISSSIVQSMAYAQPQHHHRHPSRLQFQPKRKTSRMRTKKTRTRQKEKEKKNLRRAKSLAHQINCLLSMHLPEIQFLPHILEGSLLGRRHDDSPVRGQERHDRQMLVRSPYTPHPQQHAAPHTPQSDRSTTSLDTYYYRHSYVRLTCLGICTRIRSSTYAQKESLFLIRMVSATSNFLQQRSASLLLLFPTEQHPKLSMQKETHL